MNERLTVYHDNDGWRRFTLPRLQAMGSRKVAEAVGISERRARDILKGRAVPHPKHRTELRQLANIETEGAENIDSGVSAKPKDQGKESEER
jgi:hypothetical protein